MHDDAKFCAYCGSNFIQNVDSHDRWNHMGVIQYVVPGERCYYREYKCYDCGEHFFI